jgi:hypothetical protein
LTIDLSDDLAEIDAFFRSGLSNRCSADWLSLAAKPVEQALGITMR